MESNLKNRFDGFGAAPTNELWDRIETTLDEKQRRKPLFWWVYYGIAAIFVVGLVVTQFQNPELTKNEKDARLSEVNAQKGAGSSIKPEVHANQKLDTSKIGTGKAADSTSSANANKHPYKRSEENQLKKVITAGDESSQKGNNKTRKTPVTPPKEEETNVLMELVPNEWEGSTTNEDVVVPQNDLAQESDEVPTQQEKDTNDVAVTKDSTNVDPIPLEILPVIKEPKSNRRFEIGISYSWLTGQRKPISSSASATYNMVVPGETDPIVPEANTKFYSVTIPINLHVNYGYYFNSKWRLDSELGYSQFHFIHLDKYNNKLAHFTRIRSISIPVFISYISTFKNPRHTLNYGVGVGNDLSFANWNASNRFYYGLSAQLRIGYGYYFGTSHNWKASINFVMRQTVYEAAVQKSSFNNRLLYGGQIGVSRCF